MLKKRDRDTASSVGMTHSWLATIQSNPHFQAHARLVAAASAHLLHACGFRLRPPHSPKRRKLHHHHERHHHRSSSSRVKAQAPARPEASPLQQLYHAACTGDASKLEQLCRQPGGLDIINAACGPAPGRTALHAAAEAGSAEGCRALLGLGADSYVADEATGESPLMLAAAGGHDAAVKVLLEAGADPFAVNFSGVNALMLAARAGSAPTIALLLAEGVDAGYANTDLGQGETALLLAAESGSVAAVRLLLAAGERVNRADAAGRTALWVAARNGHALVVQLLLSQPGVKHISSFGDRSTTPLDEAHAAHHASCVALLSAHLQQLEHSARPAQHHTQHQASKPRAVVH